MVKYNRRSPLYNRRNHLYMTTNTWDGSKETNLLSLRNNKRKGNARMILEIKTPLRQKLFVFQGRDVAHDKR